MSRRFYDNELEHYLKEQTDQHRMYPSDQVWRNIQNEIHGYRRWPALTFISIIMISSLVVSTVLLKPHSEVPSVNLSNTNKTDLTTKKPSANTSAEIVKNYTDKLSVEKITKQTLDKVIESSATNQPEETFVVTEPRKENSEIVLTSNPEKKQKVMNEISGKEKSLGSKTFTVSLIANSAIP